MRRIFIFIILFFSGILTGIFLEKNYYSFLDYPDVPMIIRNSQAEPVNGFVPDNKTALKIAKSVWLNIYGSRKLLGYKYRTRLINDSYWVIEGSKITDRFFGKNGGGPYIIINKLNGTILGIAYTG